MTGLETKTQPLDKLSTKELYTKLNKLQASVKEHVRKDLASAKKLEIQYQKRSRALKKTVDEIEKRVTKTKVPTEIDSLSLEALEIEVIKSQAQGKYSDIAEDKAANRRADALRRKATKAGAKGKKTEEKNHLKDAILDLSRELKDG
ncbi:MAG: hypothetical protein GYA55_13465 [SAR324 cluster bacterium]|uniref:Uncharacterized protein n=1 Tax=SAR324 cluster bacterium TaxID=2024889 RepID=A0A7X9ILE7_9DELT|nr:hypothetical protein [SAR324 cluster bacterium]